MSSEYCVCCGRDIPEGSQVCVICGYKADNKKADLVEVVRCKDCKYLCEFSAIDRQFYCRHYPHGLSGINIVEDNPYCSYGERKGAE